MYLYGLRDWYELVRIQLKREEGQTMAEYGLLIAFIAIVALVGTRSRHFAEDLLHQPCQPGLTRTARRRALAALRARRHHLKLVANSKGALPR